MVPNAGAVWGFCSIRAAVSACRRRVVALMLPFPHRGSLTERCGAQSIDHLAKKRRKRAAAGEVVYVLGDPGSANCSRARRLASRVRELLADISATTGRSARSPTATLQARTLTVEYAREPLNMRVNPLMRT